MDIRTSISSSMTNTVGALPDVIRGPPGGELSNGRHRVEYPTREVDYRRPPHPLRLQYTAETRQLTYARTIGKLRAFNSCRRAVDNMQALESQIGNEQHPAGQVREHYVGQLQEVVSRHLPMLYRRAHRY